MDRNVLEKLSEVFVQSMPKSQQFLRDGTLNPDWLPWMNSFDTWMQQLSTPVTLDDDLFAVRNGSLITVTGKVKAGTEIKGIAPARTFTHGGVEFNENGTIRGGSVDTNLSVTFIARR